jgi:DNA-binding NarL/FixJ family response regulator
MAIPIRAVLHLHIILASIRNVPYLLVEHIAVSSQPVRRPSRAPSDDLTSREREVLGLIAEGRSNQAIRAQLSLAPKTVEAHIGNIFSKLELLPAPDDHRRVLAVLAHQRGAVDR